MRAMKAAGMTDAQVIDTLGGSTRVARLGGWSVSQVNNWKKRGIAYRMRRKVAVMLVDAGKPVPFGFVEGGD